MGIEAGGFDAVPEPVVPEEVVTPDESQRVEDIEKAQVMAQAGKPDRDAAAVRRSDAEAGVHPVDSIARAGQLDNDAEYVEREAGENFDKKNEVEVDGRINDVEKAQVMANAMHPSKSLEKSYREASGKPTWEGGPEDEKYMKDYAGKMADDAEKYGEEAGKEFDNAKEGTEN